MGIYIPGQAVKAYLIHVVAKLYAYIAIYYLFSHGEKDATFWLGTDTRDTSLISSIVISGQQR